jgi:hypothetical protein
MPVPNAITNAIKSLLPKPAAPKAEGGTKEIAVPSASMAADQLSVSQGPSRTWKESGGFVREDREGDIAIWRAQDMSQTEPHFSAQKRFEEACKNAQEGDVTCLGPRYQTIKVTAQVGRYLGTEVLDSGSLPVSAHPWASKTLETLDMQTGKPVSLDTLFPAHAIHAAMMKDPLVQQALAGAKPKNLEELRDALAGKTLDSGRVLFPAEGLFDHFSFHHVKGDQVAVRLALPPAIEAARGTYTQLGLYMDIPHELKQDLKRAAAQGDSPELRAGVLWEELERKGGNPATRFYSPVK